MCEKSSVLIHSVIHSGDLYSASSRHYYSEALRAQSQTKKKDSLWILGAVDLLCQLVPRTFMTDAPAGGR